MPTHRYHNPDHYTIAFGRIIHLRRKLEGSSSARLLTSFSSRIWKGTSEEGSDSADEQSFFPWDSYSLGSVWDSSDAGDLDVRVAPLQEVSSHY
jgi:hypothetical protein